jgi:hypothetical protein
LFVLSNLPPWQQRLHSAAFVQPPWHDCHPQRQHIEDDLPSELMRLARIIDRLVDQLSLEGLVASFAGRGSTPHRPDLMLKAVLWLTQRGNHSPAGWAEQAKLNRVVAWLLRGSRPPRACWYAFRQRLLLFIDDLNGQLLALARACGLLQGEVPVLDGTLLAANSSRHKLVNKATLQRRLGQLKQAIDADGPAAVTAQGPARQEPPRPAQTNLPAQQPLPTAAPSEAAPPCGGAAAQAQPAAAPPVEPVAGQHAEDAAEPEQAAWMAGTPQGRQGQQRRYLLAQEELERRLWHNAKRRKEDRKPENKVWISLGDPQATLGLDKEKVYRPLYNVQLACDLKTDFCLAYAAFSGVQDAATYVPMLQRMEYFTGQKVRQGLLDSGYITGANLRHSEGRQIAVIGPYQENDFSKGKKAQKQIPKSEFVWEADKQQYVCPEGHPLLYQRTQTIQRGEVVEKHQQYRCAPMHCQGCERQADCTKKAATGRMVVRNEYEEEVQRHKARMEKKESKELYKKRKEQIERRYADGKEHRKLRKLSMRGLEGARLQVGLIVLAHNMVLLEKLLGRSQQPQPTAAPTEQGPCRGQAVA